MRARESQFRAAANRLSGVTLVELLVVLTIVMMITAATVPAFAPALKNRRIREASRLVSSYFAGAKVRALESGRPVGVVIDPFRIDATNTDAHFSVNLSYADVPPPYAGDYVGSRMLVNNGTVTKAGLIGSTDDQWLNQQLFVGDLVRLNYRGFYYRITSASANTTTGALQSTLDWVLTAPDGTYPTNTPAEGVPYQIIKRPLKSASSPLQMPEGTAIDLTYSGAGSSGVFSMTSGMPPVVQPIPNAIPDNGPIIVMFNPNGSVNCLYYNNNFQSPPLLNKLTTGNSLYFLIGRRSGTTYAPNKADNLEDQNNIWVGIGAMSGSITTSENVGVPNGAIGANSHYVTDVYNARTLASTQQSIGGR